MFEETSMMVVHGWGSVGGTIMWLGVCYYHKIGVGEGPVEEASSKKLGWCLGFVYL